MFTISNQQMFIRVLRCVSCFGGEMNIAGRSAERIEQVAMSLDGSVWHRRTIVR